MEEDAEQAKGRAAPGARLALPRRRGEADDDVTPSAAPDRGRRLPRDVGLLCGMSGDSNWRLPVEP